MKLSSVAFVGVLASIAHSAAAMSVTKLILIDADEDEPIFEIENGMEIVKALLPTQNINFEAVTDDEEIGSVKIVYDQTRERTDSVAPYTLKGDKNGNYFAMTLKTGAHILEATPYSSPGATGTPGQGMQVSFTVVAATRCITGDVALESNGCTYDDLLDVIEAALPADCTHGAGKELSLWTGITKEHKLRKAVSNMCADVWDELYQDSFLNHDAIAADEQNTVFTKAYYDGGTDWNDLLEKNASGIQDTFDDVAQIGGITWPGDERIMANFRDCDLRAVMCCYVARNVADNTDICYADMGRSPTAPHVAQGFSIFENDREGDAHCHGFAWSNDKNDLSARYKGNSLFYVSMYDHFSQRSYVDPVPGSPMCACVEQMAVVSRADCTQLDIQHNATFHYTEEDGLFVEFDEVASVQYEECQGADNTNNDLAAYYQRLVNEGKATADEKAEFDKHIVGDDGCDTAIVRFMAEKGWAR